MTFDSNQSSYISLRSTIKEQTNGILFWIGSGCSHAAGIPLWDELKQQLIEAFRSKIPTAPEDEADNISTKIAQIELEKSNWVAFQRLKELGDSTYRSTIRKALNTSPDAIIPQIYKNIWSLPIDGILNLNIDHLAVRAYCELTSKCAVTFTGNRIGSFLHLLKGNNKFVAHLHGTVEDVESWVFTYNELKKLTSQETYESFINSCFSTRTMVFLGISANDVASGGFLDKIRHSGGDTGDHYWISSDVDSSTARWAEEVGLRTIRYSGYNDHCELNDLFEDLKSFVPQDEIVEEPVQILPGSIERSMKANPSEKMMTPDELLNQNTDIIRLFLNEYAIKILSPGSSDAYQVYDRFCKEYDEVIHRAWYTSVEDNKNSLLEYTLLKEVACGAFGKVYKAIDRDGNFLAIKLLLPEIRRKSDLLQSFRRGVKSMRILKKQNVSGMVDYKDASEIPAFVVMDWVEGPDLNKAVKSKLITDWSDILRVSAELSSIIHSAHFLPERVLHRDIRPSNIMLETSGSINDWKVVVLDFDLSWHKGSYEKSVMHGSTSLGYLSPEQLDPSSKVSTRHSSVDSFGIGMTLFFIISGRDPIPAEHCHEGWTSKVDKYCTIKKCPEWQSICARFSRLIVGATRHEQHERLDMPQIQKEIQRIWEAYRAPTQVQSAEMVAEELAARSNSPDAYRWDDNIQGAIYGLPNGVKVTIIGDESNQNIVVRFECYAQDINEKSKIRKWIVNKADKAIQLLKKDDWSVQNDTHPEFKSINITAKNTTSKILSELDKSARCLKSVRECLS